MNKLRSDATWNTLTTGQREQLEEWLLEKNLSFRDTHERAQKELGMTCGLTTMRRIYALLLKLRAIVDIREGQDAAEDLAGAGAKLDDLRDSSMKMIAVRLLEKAMARADVKEVAALGRLMLLGEEREIQRERVNLSREKFQLNVSKAALKALPLLDELAQEEEERDLARIEAVKQKIFGKKLAGMKDAHCHSPQDSQVGPHKAALFHIKKDIFVARNTL